MKWTVCESCSGTGKIKRKKKGSKISILEPHKSSLNTLHQTTVNLKKCKICEGKGIMHSDNFPFPDHQKFPHVAIIGMGIGGLTLAVACLHRGIPFSIYERDISFSVRAQGYGLTLQQASRITKALGIEHFQDGVISTRHIVHDTDGKILGTWGMRKWVEDNNSKQSKKTNIHIARQSLRMELLNQLENEKRVFWNHKLEFITSNQDHINTLHFSVNGSQKTIQADLIVGADGIRSTVRNHLFPPTYKPLHYLGCLVILGICPLDKLSGIDSDLLDSATVFQTANGKERIYVMPYSKEAIMWQLSFSMDESEAIALSKDGALSLKKEAIKRANWHSPIPDILHSTNEKLITGYPVYDREILENELATINKAITLIGDSAHPMSPFKGQGANQAMLDGLDLARRIYIKYRAKNIDKNSIRKMILNDFEAVMIRRSSIKVHESALASQFLHSPDVLHDSDQPRRKIPNT